MLKAKNIALQFAFRVYIFLLAATIMIVTLQMTISAKDGDPIGERVRATEVGVQVLMAQNLDHRMTAVETDLRNLMKLAWLLLTGLLGKTIHDHFNMGRMRQSLHKSNNVMEAYLLTLSKVQQEHEALIKLMEATRQDNERVMQAAKAAGFRTN
jgi:hypothetical protein